MAKEWVILEDSFPLSINESVNWLKLRNGECSFIDHTSFQIDGILSYSPRPSPSPSFRMHPFISPDSVPINDEITRAWIYGRWWRPDPDNPYSLQVSTTDQRDNPEFEVATSIDFTDDDQTEDLSPIKLIASQGEGRIGVFKEKAGYLLENANLTTTSFKRNAAYGGIGCNYQGTYYTNGVIGSFIPTLWDGGDTGNPKHWLWDLENSAVELSRNVRDLAKSDPLALAEINWAQNIVSFGKLSYDIEQKRIYHYSGSSTAKLITRPYSQVQMHPYTVYELAFTHTGQEGSFDVKIQTGQSFYDLGDEQSFTVTVNSEDKKHLWHKVTLDRPLRTRVSRLIVENLSGVGITQIEYLVDQDSRNIASDGVE